MALFEGKAGCVACHAGATLSDGKQHATGAPDHPDLGKDAERQLAMLRHYSTMGVPAFMNRRSDVGLYTVTKDDKDLGKFQTPSLWDVGQTAPYMHSGVFATLAQVVDFYDAGGGMTPKKPSMLRPPAPTADEKKALVAFLDAMTGAKPMVMRPKLPDMALREQGKN